MKKTIDDRKPKTQKTWREKTKKPRFSTAHFTSKSGKPDIGPISSIPFNAKIFLLISGIMIVLCWMDELSHRKASQN